jgi:hypothetical protein
VCVFEGKVLSNQPERRRNDDDHDGENAATVYPIQTIGIR